MYCSIPSVSSHVYRNIACKTHLSTASNQLSALILYNHHFPVRSYSLRISKHIISYSMSKEKKKGRRRGTQGWKWMYLPHESLSNYVILHRLIVLKIFLLSRSQLELTSLSVCMAEASRVITASSSLTSEDRFRRKIKAGVVRLSLGDQSAGLEQAQLHRVKWAVLRLPGTFPQH